jgi:hypothetical protein
MQLVNDNPSTAHSSFSQLSDMKKPIQLHLLVRKAETLSSTVVVVALGDPLLLSSYITKKILLD